MNEKGPEEWETIDRCIMNVLLELSESTNNSIRFKDIVSEMKMSYNGKLTKKDILLRVVYLKNRHYLQIIKGRVLVTERMRKLIKQNN